MYHRKMIIKITTKKAQARSSQSRYFVKHSLFFSVNKGWICGVTYIKKKLKIKKKNCGVLTMRVCGVLKMLKPKIGWWLYIYIYKIN